MEISSAANTDGSQAANDGGVVREPLDNVYGEKSSGEITVPCGTPVPQTTASDKNQSSSWPA